MNTHNDILFLSHGGGPLPLLGDPGHREMVDQVTGLAASLRKPSAVLIISAHWEESMPTVTSGTAPSLIYDYSGFPPESYQLQYPCPGEPELARQVCQALEQAGIPARLDPKRGFDHGMFVPLTLMYPAADIPCVQLSLVNSLDANAHLATGRALQALDYQNLLVIGSGFSFHNMHAFVGTTEAEVHARNRAFLDWLELTCTGANMEESERVERLRHWERAPYARFCHPREEHLLPLHVCYGMAGRPCEAILDISILGIQAGLFYWRRSR